MTSQVVSAILRDMQKFFGLTRLISNFINSGGRFLVLIPNKIILGVRYFVWPKQSRRRYRVAILAIFLFAFLAVNLNSPNYWNKFADWANPKLGSINMPEAFSVPHFVNIPFSRGLDLQGGLHLIYEADLSQIDTKDYGESMEGLRDVIERRVNLFGVREPQVFVQESGDSYRLVVELAGITDFGEAIGLIGETPYLEFKEERSVDDQKRILRKFIPGQGIQRETEGGEKIDVESQITDEQLIGYCANPSADFLRVVEQLTGEDPCFKSTSPSLTGKYLTSASLQFSGGGVGSGAVGPSQPVVSLELDGEGAKIFKELTGRNVGKPIAIYLDGVLISAPRVQQEISGGQAQITGFSIEGAKILARNLNAGALPVPISLISQQSIGASLGEESLQKSLKAGIVGLIAIVLFMLVMYKLSGAIGVVALAIYLVLLLAVFKIIPVTLTLPGIAGLILSLGMAVDANVLVFERLREEMLENDSKDGEHDKDTGGRNFLLILNRAYSRAWPSIRDGNASTLLTCLILFWFSTSFIKGFALTLGIGVMISMFSAMIVTKYLMRFVGESRLGKKKWLWIR